MRPAPRIGALDCQRRAPTTPSPAGTVENVTSGKNFVSRGARTIGAELIGGAAGAPSPTAGWNVSVSVTLADESGLKSQRSVRKSAPNCPCTRPAVMNQPAVVAGEYTARAEEATRRRAAASEIAESERLMEEPPFTKGRCSRRRGLPESG